MGEDDQSRIAKSFLTNKINVIIKKVSYLYYLHMSPYKFGLVDKRERDPLRRPCVPVCHLIRSCLVHEKFWIHLLRFYLY